MAAESDSSSMSVEEKMHLLQRNLAETLGEEQLRSVLSERDLRIYWGTATTGRPHVGYFVPMSKIADFLRAGCHVTILFADLHAFLDNLKAPWELLAHRVEYYEFTIKSMLRAIGVPLDKLHFRRGTEYQLSREYTLDMYRLTSLVTERNALKAGAEVVKQVASPLLSGLLYPLLQALDEEYLGVDAQFGGVDQRKIFTFARENMPRLGYQKRAHLMNPMVPGLTGDKMSSSVASSKIDLLDSPEDIAVKVRGAFCEPGNVENNGVLSFVKMVLFPLSSEPFVVERKPKHGGNVEFPTYEALEEAFKTEQIYPLDLKNAVTKRLNKLLEPIRQEFAATPRWQEVKTLGYGEDVSAPAASGKGGKNKSKGKGKGKGKNKGGKNKKAGPTVLDATALDLRVARITSAVPHEQKPNLYVVELDVAADGSDHRTCVMGVADKIPAEELVGRLVVACCNLQESKFSGVVSQAMILAAYQGEGDDAVIEVIEPAEDSAVGEPLNFDDCPRQVPMPTIKTKKKKEFAKIQPHLATDDDCCATFDGKVLRGVEGPCRAKTLAGAGIK